MIMKKNVENLLISSVFMMRLFLLTIMLTLNVPLVINAQTKKADFTGDWIFNLSKSTPSVRGSRDSEKFTMVVTQNENSLTTTTTNTREDGKSFSRSTTLTLDGKENVLSPWSAVGTPPKYVATWSDNGEILVIVNTFTTQKGDMKTTQSWKLINGNTLSIIRTSNTSGTEQKTEGIYERSSTDLPKMSNTVSRIQTNNTNGTGQKTENNYVRISTGLPKMDLHFHLNYEGQSLTNAAMVYEKAAAQSKEKGVIFGIAEEFVNDNIKINDSLVLDRVTLATKNSLYLALQVSRRDWLNVFSKEVLKKVDYILADAMIFPDKDGRMMRIWIPNPQLGDPQKFMELYMAHNIKVLAEPINVWANPTYLPDALKSRYDELWTDARMKTLIDAAIKNNIAIEINSTFKIPNAKFIKMAKAAGARFTFGSNTHGLGAGDITWSINIAEDCGLTKGDFFIPKRKL
jgi:hypothetical protein